jgi:phage terminase large subunit
MTTKTRIEIQSDVFNDAYLPALDDQKRYLVLYGGAGSGKSVFAAQKILMRVLNEPGHRFLICRKVGKTLRNSVFQLFRDVVSDWNLSGLFKTNRSDMEITCINGGQLLFAGLDDVEKLKSIARITGVWIEEASELHPNDFQQINLRLRGQTPSFKSAAALSTMPRKYALPSWKSAPTQWVTGVRNSQSTLACD